MRMLAIDPASNKTGIAIFESGRLIHTSTLTTSAQVPIVKRLEIAMQLVPLISSADVVVSEEPFLQGKANQGMQRLLGMIEKLSQGSVVFYHPMTVKAALGSGTLDKFEIALAAGDKLPTEAEKELIASAVTREAWDESDAVAIGLTYIQKHAGRP
jgi:Holliday junction resolvasome RuvABC endonuclease subunit